MNFYRQEKGFAFIYKFFMQPVTLFSGVLLNICFYILIYRRKKTKFLESTKPMRYLLMAILLSDTWFLIDKLNMWIFSTSKKNSLTTIDFMCQFISYLNYFFPILLEFSMLTADFILISLVIKSNRFSRSTNNVYNDFLRRHSAEKYNQFRKLSKKRISHSLIDTEENSKEENFNRFNSLKYEKIDKNETYEEIANISLCSEESNSLNKSDLAKIKPKPFVKLIENYKFKREDAYFNIFLKEKFCLILNIFAWMYLLSFIFWIKGLTDLNSNNILKISNITTNEPIDNICSTLVYYQRLAVILNIFLSCLKIFTILMNITSSILFHFKFRHEYMLSFKSTFRKNYELTKLKMVNFKQLYFFYSTKRSWPDYNDLNKPKIHTKHYILHYKHFHFVRHYALSTFIYSLLVSFSVFTQYRDNLNQLKDLYLNRTEFDAKSPSLGKFTKIWNISHDDIIDFSFLKIGNESQTASFLDKLITIKQDDGFSIFSEYTEYLAHSTKFFIYVLFSVHFKFYIKFYKNQDK